MIQVSHLAVGAMLSRSLETKTHEKWTRLKYRRPFVHKVAITLVGLGVGMLSHYILDAVPHFEPRLIPGSSYLDMGSPASMFVWLDFFAGWGLLATLLYQGLVSRTWLTLWIIVGSYSPDVVTSGPFIKDLTADRLAWFHELHHSSHWWKPWFDVLPYPMIMFWGTLFNTIACLPALYLLGRTVRQKLRATFPPRVRPEPSA